MAGYRIATQIDIAAAPARVWSLLTDFPAMADWNPFIRAIEGELREGAKLSLLVAPPGRKSMRFRPVLKVVHPNHELCWRGRLLLPGLFDGEHAFRLQATADGGTRFHQDEDFHGILVGPLARRGMLDATRQGFEAMNAALKRRAETAG